MCRQEQQRVAGHRRVQTNNSFGTRPNFQKISDWSKFDFANLCI
jgi:hypothetical protein